MTVQPLAAYCLANSSPIPELAPVIITVAASDAAGNTVSGPVTNSPVMTPTPRMAILLIVSLDKLLAAENYLRTAVS
jgi:hypothetical protein